MMTFIDRRTASAVALVLALVAGALAPSFGRAAGEAFGLPTDDDEVVVRLVENRGPLAPEFQEGYEIAITAGGEATYTIVPVGASSDLADAGLQSVVLTAELDDDDLDDLLEELDDRGYFNLADEIDPDNDPTVGGSISLLAVTLAEDEWEVYADGLNDDQHHQFIDAQQAVVAATLAALGEAAEDDDETFDLPEDDEIVIRSVVNNGPVAPDFQTGYRIEIDAEGHTEAEFTPEGSSPDADDSTGEPERWRYDLDDEGVQGLLVVLDALGCFALPAADEAEMPDGGNVDLLRVTLDDKAREINAYGLEDEEQALFAAIQTAVAAAAGVDQFPIALF